MKWLIWVMLAAPVAGLARERWTGFGSALSAPCLEDILPPDQRRVRVYGIDGPGERSQDDGYAGALYGFHTVGGLGQLPVPGMGER